MEENENKKPLNKEGEKPYYENNSSKVPQNQNSQAYYNPSQ